MDGFKRFGLYVVPEGAFYRAGADWLGWDSVAGRAVGAARSAGAAGRGRGDHRHPPQNTAFHGTVKPPFRLA